MDMPIVMFFCKDESTNSQTVTTHWDSTEDEIKLECENFDIDPEALLKILRERPRETHTFVIDVDVFKLHHPLRDSYI